MQLYPQNRPSELTPTLLPPSPALLDNPYRPGLLITPASLPVSANDYCSIQSTGQHRRLAQSLAGCASMRGHLLTLHKLLRPGQMLGCLAWSRGTQVVLIKLLLAVGQPP